jgi:hypothetical protein
MRGILATWVALAATVLMITALFVWPGYLSITRCDPSKVPSESVDGRVYCHEPLQYPASPCTNRSNVQVDGPVSTTPFLGFTFHLSWYTNCYAMVAAWNITVRDPNGTTYQHYAPYSGTPVTPPFLWIAPDNESGVRFDPNQNPPLWALVEWEPAG